MVNISKAYFSRVDVYVQYLNLPTQYIYLLVVGPLKARLVLQMLHHIT